jgi:DNA-binding transcriptional MerR regulator
VKQLDIAEVAREARLPASTLRYYEEKGLIRSVGRRGLRRVFDAGVLERLALIALGRAAGFSLDEIAGMFAPDGQPRVDRRKLLDKAEELDRTIRELSALRDGLRHCSRLPRGEPHGMPHVPSHYASRRRRFASKAWILGLIEVGRHSRTQMTCDRLSRLLAPLLLQVTLIMSRGQMGPLTPSCGGDGSELLPYTAVWLTEFSPLSLNYRSALHDGAPCSCEAAPLFPRTPASGTGIYSGEAVIKLLRTDPARRLTRDASYSGSDLNMPYVPQHISHI